MNKINIIFCIFLLLASCTKKEQIKNIVVSKENEYWSYKDDCESHGIYFKFHSNGSYDKYMSNPIDEQPGFHIFNNDGDLLSDTRTWSLKNDSTFIWDKATLKILKCNKDSILLKYNAFKDKNKECIITLLKVYDKNN